MRSSDWSSDVCSSDLAERLHVTQSTVSARIHTLEDQLGCTLFVRNKAGTTLTPAGRQFQRHASTLVRTVEQARHDVGIPRGFRAALTVGGRFGLWEQFLLRWLPLMRESAPDISVRAEIGQIGRHTSELQSLMRISYAVFCLKKKKNRTTITNK